MKESNRYNFYVDVSVRSIFFSRIDTYARHLQNDGLDTEASRLRRLKHILMDYPLITRVTVRDAVMRDAIRHQLSPEAVEGTLNSLCSSAVTVSRNAARGPTTNASIPSQGPSAPCVLAM